MNSHRKAIVFGLDCASPELVFGEFAEQLPTIMRLAESGVHGVLKSTVPPITVPAWTCMTTGKDPGQLGLYGFRNRVDYSYNELMVSNNSCVQAERIWDVLAKDDYRSIVIGVPQTFPPRIANGLMVSGFMTPSPELDYTCPSDLKDKIEDMFGEYQFDVRNFRETDRSVLLSEIAQMTKNRFTLLRRLMAEEPWDFIMVVEIGLDRMHHSFWTCQYPGSAHGDSDCEQYRDAIRDYYALLDREIAATLELAPADAAIAVVSDHGAKAMKGGFCINEWLRQEGYLFLSDTHVPSGPLRHSQIDWSRTKAWGTGGYYGRIFLNVAGREPSGCVPAETYDDFRDELASRLATLVDDDGRSVRNRVFFPERVYAEVTRVPPDLLVYFDDLDLRSIGSVGRDSLWCQENDEGRDFANHDENGMFVYNAALADGLESGNDRSIVDVFHVIRRFFDVAG